MVAEPRYLTAAEFRAVLKLAGLRQKELAALLGVANSTVNRWAMGNAAVPQYATAYLELRRTPLDTRSRRASSF